MKRRLIDLLIIILTLTTIACYTAENLQIEKEEEFPLIVEYIDNLSLDTNDLSNLLGNQFSYISIGAVSTKDYEIISSKIIPKYLGTSKKV